MEWYFQLIILFIVLSLLERLLGAGKRQGKASGSNGGSNAPVEAGHDATAEPEEIDIWIEEEMGPELERRPRVVIRRPGTRFEPPHQPAPSRSPVPVGDRPARVVAGRRMPRVVSMEEIGMRERGAPVSLEETSLRERLREQEVRPITTGAMLTPRHVRPAGGGAARPPADLPELLQLEPLQRKVVWSEILGPPRGLEPW